MPTAPAWSPFKRAGSAPDVNEGRIEQIARLIGLQRQRIAAQEQLHRQEVQALNTAIDHAQRQIRLAQAQRTQQNRDIALLHRQWSDQQALLSYAHVSRAVFDEKERELLSSRLQKCTTKPPALGRHNPRSHLAHCPIIVQ